MKFFRSLLKNMSLLFSRKNIYWHLLAIGLTYVLVVSGFDWFYFVHTRNAELQSVLFPAVILGSFVPIFLPITLLSVGYLEKKTGAVRTGWILVQSELIAMLLSFMYKAFTGRVSPHSAQLGTDVSHMFRFGFMRGGVFWGWPSSHTTVAFATAFTLITLFPRSRKILILMLAYAFYVGIGVSATIHWFSEFAAGGIFGSLVGVVVAKGSSAYSSSAELHSARKRA
jgi:membrane-associated phospholipid phosphatase